MTAKTLLIAIVAALAAAAMLALPLSAGAGEIHRAAKQECKHERRTDRQDFIRDYGGTGKRALKRCVRFEKRHAKQECKHERRTDRQDFIRDYGGTGKRALKRCIVAEIR